MVIVQSKASWSPATVADDIFAAGFAVVKRGRDKATGEPVAVKVCWLLGRKLPLGIHFKVLLYTSCSTSSMTESGLPAAVVWTWKLPLLGVRYGNRHQ
jgi:hypothetical protein